MTDKLFITGDRSASPIYGPLVAIEMLKAVNTGKQIVTGDNAGVEELVRDLAIRADLDVLLVETTHNPDTGKPAWDSRHKQVHDDGLPVVVIHADVQASSMSKSLFALYADNPDAVRLVTPLDLLDISAL